MATAVNLAETRTAEVGAAMVTAEAQAQEVADAKNRASATAEGMQMLRMDALTLSAMFDHLEALDASEKAHQHVLEALEAARKEAARAMETAQNVLHVLAQGHAGLAEAHQNAPVAAADREFYAD
jgi:chromosome segregation ATPase